MYEDYFGFSENPFSLTPDPKYHFRSATHANAFELVRYAIARGEGSIAIVGGHGMGKTTLCRALVENLDRANVAALVSAPVDSEQTLLRVLLQEFGVVSRDVAGRGGVASATIQALSGTLTEFLLSLATIGAQALVVVDEAQSLPIAVLDRLRVLSRVEKDHRKLLQVVLVGQTELREVLGNPELRPRDRWISTTHALEPLSRVETAAYVTHRLAIAAGGEAVSFSPGAIARLHGCTAGVPRLVNVLCDRALLAACADRATCVRSGHVDRAAEALDLERPGRLLLAWAR